MSGKQTLSLEVLERELACKVKKCLTKDQLRSTLLYTGLDTVRGFHLNRIDILKQLNMISVSSVAADFP